MLNNAYFSLSKSNWENAGSLIIIIFKHFDK
ncbi:MAG: hypothetical protein MRECE_3c038 [Mycoplasmataceae bacterium CE_OT135]|nr:MAG: hypothetical protein MRECE_3c038 [Mycoplasmataceae bacterium CE_OT135]